MKKGKMTAGRKRKMTAGKKLTVLALMIIAVFFVLNLFWYINTFFPCYGYTHCMERDPFRDPIGVGYEKRVGDYNCAVSVPFYMDYVPFMSITPAAAFCPQVESEVRFSLHIWPEVGGTYDYGVDIDKGENSYTTCVDKDGNYIPNKAMSADENDEAKKLNLENRSTITEELALAKKLWGLNGQKDITNGMKLYFSEHLLSGIVALLIFGFIFSFAGLVFKWLFSSRLLFGPYIAEVNKERKKNKEKVYLIDIDNCRYFVQMPGFLKNDGYLSVRYNGSPVKLMVYPKKNGKNQFFVKYTMNGLKSERPFSEVLEDDGLSEVDKEEARALLKEAKEFWPLCVDE